MKAEADEIHMKAALRECRKALAKNETPIGAVAVRNGKIVARAHNLRESRTDPLGHAEIVLIRKLAKKFKSWRLPDITLYVTLEPCLMCLGAIFQSRMTRLVFGALDPKAGVCGSLYDLSTDTKINHHLKVTKGILAKESSEILKSFFKTLRLKNKST